MSFLPHSPLPAHRPTHSQQAMEGGPSIPPETHASNLSSSAGYPLMSTFSQVDLYQALTERYEEVELERNGMWTSNPNSQVEQDKAPEVHMPAPFSPVAWRSPTESATTTPSDGLVGLDYQEELPALITGDAYGWLNAGPAVISQESTASSRTLVNANDIPPSNHCDVDPSSLSIYDDISEASYSVSIETENYRQQPRSLPSRSPVTDPTAGLPFCRHHSEGAQDYASDFQLEDYDDDDGGSVYEDNPRPAKKRRSLARSSLSRLRDPGARLLPPPPGRPTRTLAARHGESSNGPRSNRSARTSSPKKPKAFPCNYRSPFHDGSRACNSFKSPYDMLRHVRDIHGLEESKLVKDGRLNVLDARAYLAAIAYELKNDHDGTVELRRQAATVGKKLEEASFRVEEYQLFLQAAVEQLPKYGSYACDLPGCKLTFAVKRSMERHKRNNICQKKSSG